MIRSAINLILIILSLLVIQVNALSQSDSLKQNISVNSADSSGKISPHALYSGIGIGSNMIYLGTTISGNKPFGYGALTYGYDNKLYLSASAIHITDLDPYFAFFSGTLSYTHTFNSWFDIAGSISTYQVAPSLTDTLFNSFNYADLTLGIDWRIIYTRLYAGRLMGDEKGTYIQIKNSRYFETPGFGRWRATVSFDPYINILFGTMTKSKTITGTTTVFLPPFKKWKTRTQTTTDTEYYNEFGLMEIDLGIPVSLNLGKMTIETEAGYIFPFYKDSVYPGAEGFYMLISAYFKIL